MWSISIGVEWKVGKKVAYCYLNRNQDRVFNYSRRKHEHRTPCCVYIPLLVFVLNVDNLEQSNPPLRWQNIESILSMLLVKWSPSQIAIAQWQLESLFDRCWAQKSMIFIIISIPSNIASGEEKKSWTKTYRPPTKKSLNALRRGRWSKKNRTYVAWKESITTIALMIYNPR